jgi:hypothetical protein
MIRTKVVLPSTMTTIATLEVVDIVTEAEVGEVGAVAEDVMENADEAVVDQEELMAGMVFWRDRHMETVLQRVMVETTEIMYSSS